MRKKKMSKEVLIMIIQTIVLSILGAWFVAWGFTEENETFRTFLLGLTEKEITTEIFLRLWFWFVPIFLIINGLINLGVYVIVSNININKKKK